MKETTSEMEFAEITHTWTAGWCQFRPISGENERINTDQCRSLHGQASTQEATYDQL